MEAYLKAIAKVKTKAPKNPDIAAPMLSSSKVKGKGWLATVIYIFLENWELIRVCAANVGKKK